MWTVTVVPPGRSCSPAQPAMASRTHTKRARRSECPPCLKPERTRPSSARSPRPSRRTTPTATESTEGVRPRRRTRRPRSTAGTAAPRRAEGPPERARPRRTTRRTTDPRHDARHNGRTEQHSRTAQRAEGRRGRAAAAFRVPHHIPRPPCRAPPSGTTAPMTFVLPESVQLPLPAGWSDSVASLV